MKSPYEILSEILSLTRYISTKLGEVNTNFLQKQSPHLRKQNRIKTIHSSLKIEGNIPFLRAKFMKQIFLFFLLLNCLISFAQKQNNNWYFGYNAGVGFNSGEPVALTNGALRSVEGSAVWSDADGNLMFYTNGGPYQTDSGAVWNRNHQMMPNGNLQNEGGCSSSVQSSLIIPDPGNASRFYLFTTDCIENDHAGGLRYSIIDMTLDGGLGDLTDKGLVLKYYVHESMCGIRHANGTDFWVIVHEIGTNRFLSYLVNQDTISLAMVNEVGPNLYYGGGQMSANVEGSKIALASVHSPLLLDFDAATGIVSNSLIIGTSAYGAVFSPSCQYVYFSVLATFPLIYQYDLLAADIPASEILIYNDEGFNTGQMQLGPDGKIYVAEFWSQRLGIIHNPDEHGLACNYQLADLYLGGRETGPGLPNIITGLYGDCGFNQTTSLKSDNDNVFGIYPNPAEDYLVLSTNGQAVFIEIYDITGAAIKGVKATGEETLINLKYLPPGIFLTKVFWGSGTVSVKKFVHQ